MQPPPDGEQQQDVAAAEQNNRASAAAGITHAPTAPGGLQAPPPTLLSNRAASTGNLLGLQQHDSRSGGRKPRHNSYSDADIKYCIVVNTPGESGSQLIPSSPQPVRHQNSRNSADSFTSDVGSSSLERDGKHLTPAPTVSAAPSTPSSSGRSADKKRKNWYNVLTPSYKSKSEDFRRLFKDVPETERLVVDYSCAVQRDILVQGRLYVSQNYLCFHANIFRWETTLVLRFKDITSITKEKTARVFPNAIQVTTKEEKHFFTSFGTRDKTFLMLFRIWQNTLIEQPISEQELYTWVRQSYGDELGLTTDEDDDCDDDCEDVGGDVDEDEFLDSSESDPGDGGDAVSCACDSHDGRCILDSEYNIPVDQMFSFLFTDHKFYHELAYTQRSTELPVLNQREYKDIVLGEWSEAGGAEVQGEKKGGARERLVTYNVAVNSAIGRQLSNNTEKQTCHAGSQPGKCYSVECEVASAGVPYGDSFNVVNRYCLSRCSTVSSRIKLHTKIVYKTKVWGMVKGFIERNVAQALHDYFVALDKKLKAEALSLPAKAVPKTGKRVKRKKESTATSIRKRNLSKLDTTSADVKLAQPGGQTSLNGLANPDFVVRVVLCILTLLLAVNALLFVKLWSLENTSEKLQSTHKILLRPEDFPDNKVEWAELLQHQQKLHDQEITRWKNILDVSLKMVDQMQTSLLELKASIITSAESAENLRHYKT